MRNLHSRASAADGSQVHRRAAGAALAASAVLTVVIAGCSGSNGSAQVASLAGQSSGSHNSSQLTANQSDQDMVDFARCMRQHGVAMSDPFHRPGHVGLSIELPTRDSASEPGFAACTHFLQPVIAMKEAGAAAQAAPELPALTRYAECMRSRDIAMLDPTSDGQLNLGVVPGISSDFGRNSPQFRAADSACRHLLPAGVQDDGTGP
jgi:hypothetical protein